MARGYADYDGDKCNGTSVGLVFVSDGAIDGSVSGQTAVLDIAYEVPHVVVVCRLLILVI